MIVMADRHESTLRLTFAATVLFASAPGIAAAAETLVRPSPGAVSANPCAAHGPGFARVAGSETCVKIGGHIRVEAGVSNHGRAQPGPNVSGTAPPVQFAPLQRTTFGPLPSGAAPVGAPGQSGLSPLRTQVRVRPLPGGYPALR